MEGKQLYLIRPAGPGSCASRPLVVGIAAGLVGLALLATLAGADRTRRPPNARERAAEAIERAVRHGSRDEGVRAEARAMRRDLGRSPLDSPARVAYAGLLLGLSRSLDDTEAAVFHAEQAARLAPVTVSVNQAAAIVLARSARGKEALALTREMFGYDPEAAARLLARLEPLLIGVSIELGLPAEPDGGLAWARRLRQLDRHDEARAALRRVHENWPRHVPTLELLASQAATRRDWSELRALLPDDFVLDDERTAPLILMRARLLAHLGENERAVAEVERALALVPDSGWLRMLAADAHAEMGADDEARNLWTRALYELPRDNESARRHVLASLARLERRQGRLVAALRHWRSILELDPEDADALRQVEELLNARR